MSDKPLVDRPIWQLMDEQEKGLEADLMLFAKIMGKTPASVRTPKEDEELCALIREVDATRRSLSKLSTSVAVDLDVCFTLVLAESHWHESERSKEAREASREMVELAKLKRAVCRRMLAFEELYRAAQLGPTTYAHHLGEGAREAVREECLNALTLYAIQTGKPAEPEGETK